MKSCWDDGIYRYYNYRILLTQLKYVVEQCSSNSAVVMDIAKWLLQNGSDMGSVLSLGELVEFKFIQGFRDT